MQLSINWILRLVFIVMIQCQVYSLPKIGRKYVIDLIESLPAINTTIMQPVPGFHIQSKAYYLRNVNQKLELPRSTVRKALNLLEENGEFTFLAIIKQRRRNSGTIFSISKGTERYLELHISGRKKRVRLYYRHNKRLIMEEFPYELDDNQWHQVAMSVSGAHATLYVDCNRIYERVIKPIDRSFRLKGVSLWLGQRTSKFSYFRGTIQDVKIVARPYGYTLQCPNLDTACPTCGQFNALEDTVSELKKYLKDLSKKLDKAEEKISYLESCECMKSCDVNGTQYRDGESWMRDKCQRCTCRGGEETCGVECPPLDCLHPVQLEGKCCKFCLRQCFHNRRSYEHGEVYTHRSPSRRPTCMRCSCQDGSMECRELDMATICPPLNCSERYQKADECCEVCKEQRSGSSKDKRSSGTDYCAQGHKCHSNATCINFDTRYACQCNQGFHGDGITCEDVNECTRLGGSHGHHCGDHTQCINTVGSYYCRCLPGYTTVDAFTCQEHNECLTGQNDCDENADCINTVGSYECKCKAGYPGNGKTCKATCKESCLHGGTCVAPDTCKCRHGFRGKLCEIDIDECALGLDNCHKNSQCVNLPGWYYCKCKEGYSSRREDNRYGRLCRDVNECSEARDSCHRSSRCVNTDGGYVCSCDGKKHCSQNCVYMGLEYANGTTFKKPDKNCHICSCKSGRVVCQSEPCDCSSPTVSPDCCPHCVHNAHCAHPDTQQIYQNGETWLYDCEICECLDGEVDCWNLNCPELACEKTVQLEGECCPRCQNDNPCQRPARKHDNTSATCNYNTTSYKDGATWHLSRSHHDCTLCECRASHICCSYNPTSCQEADEELVVSTDKASLSEMQIIETDTDGETDSRHTGPAVTDTGQIGVGMSDSSDLSVVSASEHISDSLSGGSQTPENTGDSLSPDRVRQSASDGTEKTARSSKDGSSSLAVSPVPQSTWTDGLSRLLNVTSSRKP
ncbi:protein kinase C-binding protein NELL1-like isoform X3 [Lineus longissimus]|uniref:protein kinase C-binding protein NELL1-like isoform X3 n=1 Tax=Lineus longissimus TaxID=88925 RepID=UPI00315CBE40